MFAVVHILLLAFTCLVLLVMEGQTLWLRAQIHSYIPNLTSVWTIFLTCIWCSVLDNVHISPWFLVKSTPNTTGCPTRYQTRHFFNNFTTNEDIATKFETDLPHCVRNVKEKNVLLFKFRCNIFIGVRIIKETLIRRRYKTYTEYFLWMNTFL